MLSESLQELLSAYVDGELGPTEYERVMAALRESEIARNYVNNLRDMSGQLKTLPKLTCPPKLTGAVLREQQKKQLKSRSIRRYGYAAALAAAVLVGIGVWMYLTTLPQPNIAPINNNVALNNNPQPTSPLPPIVLRRHLEWAELQPFYHTLTMALGEQWSRWNDRYENTLAWVSEADAIREGRFLESRGSLLTSPVKETSHTFKTVESSLPLYIAPTEFSLPTVQGRLAKQGTFVLDITTRNPSRTLSRLLETAKLPITLDEEVKTRQAKNTLGTTMIYLENLTPEQLSAWLSALQLADYWNVPEYRTDGTCKSLLLYSLDAGGYGQLARSLGVSAWSGKAQKDVKAVAVNYVPTRKPGTLGEVVKQFSGPKKDGLTLVVMIRN
jgi:hypothetical protein